MTRLEEIKKRHEGREHVTKMVGVADEPWWNNHHKDIAYLISQVETWLGHYGKLSGLHEDALKSNLELVVRLEARASKLESAKKLIEDVRFHELHPDGKKLCCELSERARDWRKDPGK